jgi:hypothetical protein
LNVKQSNQKYKKVLAGIIAFLLMILGFKVYFSLAPPPRELTFQEKIQKIIDDESGKTEIINQQKEDLNDRLKENRKADLGPYILKTIIAATLISAIPIVFYINLSKKKEKTNKAENRKIKQNLDEFNSIKTKKEARYDKEDTEVDIINDNVDIDYSKKQNIPILETDINNKSETIIEEDEIDDNQDSKLENISSENEEINLDTEDIKIEEEEKTSLKEDNKENISSEDSLPDIPKI